MSRRGWVLFAVMSVIWGIPYLLIRIAVRDISPATLVFLRTAPAGLVLLPLIFRRGYLHALRTHWRAVVLFSVVELGIPWLLLFRAEQRLSSSLAGLLVATVPLIAVLLSKITRHEAPLGWRRFVGLGIGFGGVALVVGIDVHGTDLIAVLEIAIVAVGYSFGPLVVSRYLSDVPSIAVLCSSLVLTSLAYAPLAIPHMPKKLSIEEVVSVILLIAVCTIAAFLIFFVLIAEVGPARATLITYVNPAIAVVLGVLILHERFSLGIGLGFPLVILGCYLGAGGIKPRPAPELSDT